MSDAMIAADVQGEEGKEAHDFVEVGSVSEDTKGTFSGDVYDGGIGRFNA